MNNLGLATAKSEGMSSSYDGPDIIPWDGCGKEFQVWFDSRFKFYFGTKWLKPILKKYLRDAWDNALLMSAKKRAK